MVLCSSREIVSLKSFEKNCRTSSLTADRMSLFTPFSSNGWTIPFNTLSDCSLLYGIFITAISVADGSGSKTFRKSGTVFSTYKAGSGYESALKPMLINNQCC
jgi:hypothetical protein